MFMFGEYNSAMILDCKWRTPAPTMDMSPLVLTGAASGASDWSASQKGKVYPQVTGPIRDKEKRGEPQ